MRRLQLAARGIQALLRAGGSNWMPAAGGVQLQGPQAGGQAAAAAALAAAGAAASAGHWALAEEAQVRLASRWTCINKLCHRGVH